MAGLGRLFGRSKKTNKELKVPQLSSAVSSAVMHTVGARGIPPMPAAAHRAFQLSTDPNAEARDFIGLIESDEALASRVIKIANSVFYDRGKKSTTVEECVLVIGLSELRGLLNANSLSDIFPCPHPARAQLWANDIATALIARSLASRVKPGAESLAFLGGLMHDLGKLLLLQRNTEDYLSIMQRVETRGISFGEAEAEKFPFDHTEAGQLIGEKWRFSDELLEVIRNHHAPRAETIDPAGIVGCADALAHALGLGHPQGYFRFQSRAQERLPEVWRYLKIPEREHKDLLAGFKRSFDVEYDLYAGNFSG